jgi:cobalt/nickel transport system permease protein
MASDYADPAIRTQIAAASFNHVAPASAPHGLVALSTIWTAPFARYAPPYIRSAAFGYLLSAMFGTGLIVVACLMLGRFTRSAARGGPEAP